jgi:hypothetical protein
MGVFVCLLFVFGFLTSACSSESGGASDAGNDGLTDLDANDGQTQTEEGNNESSSDLDSDEDPGSSFEGILAETGELSGMVVDGQHVYWSWRYSGKLLRVAVDGTGEVEEIVENGINGHPYGLAYEQPYIYAGTSHDTSHQLLRYNRDTNVLDIPASRCEYGVTVTQNYIFCVFDGNSAIVRFDKNSFAMEPFLVDQFTFYFALVVGQGNLVAAADDNKLVISDETFSNPRLLDIAPWAVSAIGVDNGIVWIAAGDVGTNKYALLKVVGNGQPEVFYEWPAGEIPAIWDIALDDSHLYYTVVSNWGNEPVFDGYLGRISLTGNSPEVIKDSLAPVWMVIDQQAVYWFGYNPQNPQSQTLILSRMIKP